MEQVRELCHLFLPMLLLLSSFYIIIIVHKYKHKGVNVLLRYLDKIIFNIYMYDNSIFNIYMYENNF